MSENAYVKAENAHRSAKYHLEQDIKRFAPYVPEVQTSLIPPKGRYCNSDYTFCPSLLWGGFCTELCTELHAVDGEQFTKITAEQFWDCLGEGNKPHRSNTHEVAVGAYLVFEKCCTKTKSKTAK